MGPGVKAALWKLFLALLFKLAFTTITIGLKVLS